MTFTKFFGYSILLAVVSGFLVYLSNTYFSSSWGNYFLWVSVALVTIALVRRLGFINYLESFLTAGVWVFFRLLFDALFTAPNLGTNIYNRYPLWVSYGITVLVIIIFHKKRHVGIRRDMKKHHH